MLKTNRQLPTNLGLLIFDLDGTLVDSRQDLANSINAMLSNYQRGPLRVDVIASYIGDGAPTLVRRSLGFHDDHDLGPPEEEFIEDALIFFIEYYREHKLDSTCCYPGVLDALAAIHARKPEATMAVLSNKPVNPSRAIVEHLGMARFFKAIYGGNSFETKKPDPLGAQKLLSEFGADANETVIIGDSHIDVQTAQNSGIWSVGVTYGLDPQSLKEWPPDVLVDSPAEWGELLCRESSAVTQ